MILTVKPAPNFDWKRVKINNAKPSDPFVIGIFGFSVIILYGHSFATHLLEDGVNIHHIKQLLGHSAINSTYFYLRLQGVGGLDVISPLDRIVGTSSTGNIGSGGDAGA